MSETEKTVQQDTQQDAGHYTTYEAIVESWGYEIVDSDCTGSWQGDYQYLLRDDDGRWGFLVIGYGSCSGCDALEAILPWDFEDASDEQWDEVRRLADSYRGDINWFESGADAVAFLREHFLDQKDPNHWYSFDDEVVAVIGRFVEKIED